MARVCLLLVVILVGACASGGIETRLPGSRIDDAERGFGIRLTDWRATDMPGYEVACDLDHRVTMFGAKGTLCAVRRDGRIAAIDFHVSPCSESQYDALREQVVRAFDLGDIAGRDVYAVRSTGVIHLRTGADETARLALTDAAYGDLYVAQGLRDGFVDLSNGLRPH